MSVGFLIASGCVELGVAIVKPYHFTRYLGLYNGGKMTKAELVDEVALAAKLTKKESEVIVEEVFRNIIQTLNRGEKIELRGFGSFRIRQRKARRGRNPKTGDPVDIPAKRVPYFKPGKELKEMINPGEGDVEYDDED
ncbi:MAG: HU family DNA-binding protein [Blastocatellia bacterium]